MKSTDFKRIGKHLGVKLIMVLLCLTLICSSVSVFAMTQIAEEDRMGHGDNGDGRYYSSFTSNDELKAVTKETNIEIAGEGAILLKNGGGVSGDEDKLPYTTMKNISVFGINSDAFGYGGTGSGSGQLEEGADIYTSFEAEGLNINPRLKELYQKYSGGSLSDTSAWSVPTYEDKELPMDYYTESIQKTYASYSDAAFVVIGRLGGEGADLAVENVPDRVRPTGANGALETSKNEHYLELTYREEQLIEHVKSKFDKVVVLLNSGNIIELGELKDDPGIDAIVHIGQTGDYGFRGILKVLKGEVNPSGRTVDIYTRDFMVDPVMKNFGGGEQYDDVYEGAANVSYKWKPKDSTETNFSKLPNAGSNVLEYEEGIYMGYKYYETMAAEIKGGSVDLTDAATKAALESADLNGTGSAYKAYIDADDWYNRNVVYPFGYGLSYTTFEWSDFEVTMSTGTALTKDTIFTASVTVTNTGEYAGKDVVEIYMDAPYYENGIEKAKVSLVGFAKTKTLAKGESETVTVKFDAYDIAAYDWNDLNGNNNTGYELDAGDYVFYASKNSHSWAEEGTLSDTVTLAGADKYGKADYAPVILDKSQYTNVDVDNAFINPEDPKAVYNYSSISPTMTIMSRSDMIGTYPASPTEAERTLEPGKDNYNKNKVAGKAIRAEYQITEEEIYNKINWGFVFGRDDDAHEIWKGDVGDMTGWTQAADDKGTVSIRLADLMGTSPYSEEPVKSDNAAIDGKPEKEAWKLFMNQLTYEEMKALNSIGFFKTQGIDRIGKEEAVDADGPCTIGGQTKDGYISARGSSGTRYWCSAQMVAATWNTELAHRQGLLIGEEGMWNGYNGWYAPSMNTHRSPFSGRNFEYYSQDGVHGGLITAAVLSGVSSRGVYPYIKHFALNDQETNRNNVRTWADEQTIREIYLRPFQYAVVSGGASGVMTGFNCIGVVACSENYPLMTTILRNEWGWEGTAVTDYQVGTVGNTLNNLEVMHRAGTNIPLGDRAANARGSGVWDATLNNGKGGVKVNAWVDGKQSTKDFITSANEVSKGFGAGYVARQYWFTRTRAMELLYTHMRSNAIDNGADFQKNFPAQTVELPAGISYSYALETGFGEYDDVKFEVTDSKLPTGVTFNASSLTFSTSNNAVAGSTGSVTIKVSYDSWANKEVKINVAVAEPIKYDGSMTVPVGEAYTATVSQKYWTVTPGATPDGNVAGTVSVVGSVQGLPEGLSFDAATGRITGTTTAAGEYDVTLNYAVTVRSYNWWMGSFTNRTTNYKRVVTLEVGDLVTVTVGDEVIKVAAGSTITAPEAPQAPEGMQFVGWYNGETAFDFTQPVTADVTLTAVFEPIPDSIEFRVNEETGKIEASINGGEWVEVVSLDEITGPQGAQGDKGDKGDQGAPAEGCGSFAGAATAIAVAGAFGLAFIGIMIAKAAKERKGK